MINKRPSDVERNPDRTFIPHPSRVKDAPIPQQSLTSLVRDLLQNLGDQVKQDFRENNHFQRFAVKFPKTFDYTRKLTRKRKIQLTEEETDIPADLNQTKRVRLSEEQTTDKQISYTSLLFSDLKQTIFTANANENNDNSTLVSSNINCELSEEEKDIFTDFCLTSQEDDPSSAEIFAKLSGRSLSYNTNPLSSFDNSRLDTTQTETNFESGKLEELRSCEKFGSVEKEQESHNPFFSLSKLVPVSTVQHFPCANSSTSSLSSTKNHISSDTGLYKRSQRVFENRQGFLLRAARFANLSPLQGYNFGDFTDNGSCLTTTRNKNTNATTSQRPVYLTRRLKNPGLVEQEFVSKGICDLVVAKNSGTGLLTPQLSRHTTTSTTTSSTSQTTTSSNHNTLLSVRGQSTRICACSSQLVHTKTCDAFYAPPQVRKVTFRPHQRRNLNKSPEPVGKGKLRKETQVESNSFDQDIAASVRCLCRIEEKCPSCQAKRDQTSRSPPLEESSLITISGPGTAERKQVNAFKRSHSCGSKQTQGYSGFNKNFLKQRSFSNNHKCFEESDHQKSARADRNSHHCCDPFCLLFGGSSSHSSNPSLVFSKLLYAAQAASPKSRNLGIITPDQTDMGCFHSVSNKSKVGPCRTNIHSDVQATIDQSPTVIEEYSPIVLRYRTPYFRASAQVVMPPIRRKETWTVGWIQACDYMKFINQYGNLGCSSWEIPALKSGRIPAVSDSDGVSYPWYGNTTEIATIVGPTDSYRSMNLTMNDNFYPSVTWDIPVSEGTSAHLTRIVRDQSFVTWLAAINETTKEIIVLKTVRWKFYLEIDIDPSRELGSRSRIVAPRIQKQPLITNGPCEKSFFNSPIRNRRRGTDNNSNSNYVGQIPISALVRPSANNAQTLIWRPTDATPIIVVPAKEEHKDTNELILFNGCSAMHGKESIVKEISKQEMLQFQQMAR